MDTPMDTDKTNELGRIVAESMDKLEQRTDPQEMLFEEPPLAPRADYPTAPVR